MPIEINEVHVRIVANENANGGQTTNTTSPQGTAQSEEKILEQSVEQMLQIMRDKKER
jgi:hypothetical protein